MHLFVTVLTIALLCFQAMLAAAIISPVDLGLTHQAIAWMSVINVGVGVLLNQLRALGSGQPTPPGTKLPGYSLGDGEREDRAPTAPQAHQPPPPPPPRHVDESGNYVRPHR